MFVGGHLYGGASLLRKYKIGATFANLGIITINGTAGIIPCTTTDFVDTVGLALDTGTYATTAEALVTVDFRPDTIIRALMSGGAAEGTALTIVTEDTGDATRLTITGANAADVDMTSGTVWGRSGNNVAQSRRIASDTTTTIVVTVEWDQNIAIGDTYLECPYGFQGTGAGDVDGFANLQTSTLFTQADASIVGGTGGNVIVNDLELNGTGDSYVLFTLYDHIVTRTSA